MATVGMIFFEDEALIGVFITPIFFQMHEVELIFKLSFD